MTGELPGDAILTAREAIARCLADVEDCPEPEHYALADDVLLALSNAGVPPTDAPVIAAQATTTDHQQCQADWDQLREYFREQFPPCPNCGCRTSDDADSRDCGCDTGCNHGEYPPGVNVLLAQATTTEREACAQLAETEAQYWTSHGNTIQAATLRVFADLTRKRGAQ